MNYMSAVGLALLLFSARAEAAIDYSRMRLTFNDEFNGASLNRTKWNPFYTQPGTINNEDQSYETDALVPDASLGLLRIRADKRNLHGKGVTSGAITTAGLFAQTYGYFEMRAKLPPGSGFWPAFWLLPQNGSWPPELDVMEFLGRTPKSVYFTYHWLDGTQHKQQQQVLNTRDLTTYYHTYAIEWRPSLLVWYVDNQEVFRQSGAHVFNGPMYLLANMAVGGNWNGPTDANTPFPASMDVDYIRAYQFDNVPQVAANDLVLMPAEIYGDKAKAGATIQIKTKIQVNNKDITNGSISVYVYDFLNQQVFDRTYYTITNAKAGSTVSNNFDFKVPAGLPDGQYNVAMQVRGTQKDGTAVKSDVWLNSRFTVQNGAGPAALPKLPNPIQPNSMVFLSPEIPELTAKVQIGLSLGTVSLNRTVAKPGDTVGVTADMANSDHQTSLITVASLNKIGSPASQLAADTVKLANVGASARVTNKFNLVVPKDLPDGYYTVGVSTTAMSGPAQAYDGTTRGYQAVAAVLWVSAAGTQPLANIPAGILGTDSSGRQVGVNTPNTPDPVTPVVDTPVSPVPLKLTPIMQKSVILGSTTLDRPIVKAGDTITATYSFKPTVNTTAGATFIGLRDANGQYVSVDGKNPVSISTALKPMKANETLSQSLKLVLPANLKAGSYGIHTQVWTPELTGYQAVAASFEVR